MIQLRKSSDRGHANHGWLDSYHTFSFADYYDPNYMGFSSLRVINDDRIEPAIGFPTHPHRDMEIVTYMLQGALAHKDSLGNGSVIETGEVQRMTAGTGITHSEFNASKTDGAHLLQIWIMPDRKGYTPSYEQKRYAEEGKAGRLCLVASPDGRDGSVSIHQDAFLYASILRQGDAVQHSLAPGRCAYLQVARGEMSINDMPLQAGDGAAITEESDIRFTSNNSAEVLLFDLAA
jgi:redox-sensitive bicupin YhaK (pirin superfamily)